MDAYLTGGLDEAFALVEVVFALAVVTFAIIGLIALFNIGLRVDGHARDDTVIAAMSSRIVAQLSSATNATAVQGLASSNYYFDITGSPAQNPSVYSAAITLNQTNLPSIPSGKIIAAQIQITWPAVRNPPNTNIINVILPPSS